MPNKDWYWDRFDVDVIPTFFGNDDILDLSDEQTSALAERGVEGRSNYTDDQRTQYETRFIDELYGTDERAWDTAHGEEPTQGAYSTTSWQHSHPAISGMGKGSGKVSAVTWGLDLVRDWTGKEHLKVGSDEHYAWQTRGTVDWAHYYNDNAYQKAFADMRKAGEVSDDFSNVKDFLTDKSNQSTDQMRVDFITAARGRASADDVDNSKSLRDTWENKYVDQFDPETAKPYTPTYLEVPDLWGEADIPKPLTPKTITPPAGLPTLGEIQRTQVNVPDSLRNWGAVSSAPKEKFKAGGGGGES